MEEKVLAKRGAKTHRRRKAKSCLNICMLWDLFYNSNIKNAIKLLQYPVHCLSLWLIGAVCAEPETVISRAWVQSPDPAE